MKSIYKGLSITQGKTLYLAGDNHDGWSHSETQYSTLSITGDVSISGNVMGLLDNAAKSWEQGNIANIPCDYCFYCLFRNSAGIKSVSEDFLPSAILRNSCYQQTFSGRTALTAAPDLSATTLANSCYWGIFSGCASLNLIKIGYTSNYSDDYFLGWVEGIASSSTFYYDGSQTAQTLVCLVVE